MANFCDKTKEQYSILETAIKNDKSRYWCYWLLVFPKSTYFENHTFSDDAIQIKKHNLDFEEEVLGGAVIVTGEDIYWRIALSGGDRITSPDTKPPPSQ